MNQGCFLRLFSALLIVVMAGCIQTPAEPDPNLLAACIPGQTEVCACTDGSRGAQQCKSDKTFASCACEAAQPADAGTSAPMSDAGTSTIPSNRCVPGRSIECACRDGRTGAQVCSTEGLYGDCSCTSGNMPQPDAGTPSAMDAGMTDAGQMMTPDAGFNGNCPPRFTGTNCDQCIGNYTGPTCSSCKPGFTGLACDQCANPRFTGALCNECSDSSATGPNCDQWGFQKVATGLDHVCGIKLDGEILCWGQNHLGQGTAPVGQFMDVTAGANFTCGMRMNGFVECWGDNNGSQATPPAMTAFSTFAAPRSFTVGNICGVKASGEIACWGDFQLGIIPMGNDFVEVGTGDLHQCARKTDGTLVCWGGSSGGSNLPTMETFTKISTYESGNCGVTTMGRVKCWGNPGFFNNIAPGGVDQFNPIGGTDFIDISIGDLHACAVRANNSLVCWGRHELGQTTVPEGQYVSVNVSQNYSCGIQLDDSVKCWGVGTVNQTQPPQP